MQRTQRVRETILASIVLCTASVFHVARAEPSAETIARGKAMAEAADCISCHTADPSRPFAGGKRIDTPFGAIYSPNLTPDRDTGIGAWSDAEIKTAITQGKSKDGSPLKPPMGYPHYAKMTDADLTAVVAYLRTVPAKE